MSKTLTFKNTLYNIIDSGDIGNGWKYVEVIDKKQAFSLPKCLYYKGKSMKNLLSYTDYVNHLDMGKGFINDFVKDIFRECYPGSKNPICKVKESLMIGGADPDEQSNKKKQEIRPAKKKTEEGDGAKTENKKEDKQEVNTPTEEEQEPLDKANAVKDCNTKFDALDKDTKLSNKQKRKKIMDIMIDETRCREDDTRYNEFYNKFNAAAEDDETANQEEGGSGSEDNEDNEGGEEQENQENQENQGGENQGENQENQENQVENTSMDNNENIEEFNKAEILLQTSDLNKRFVIDTTGTTITGITKFYLNLDTKTARDLLLFGEDFLFKNPDVFEIIQIEINSKYFSLKNKDGVDNNSLIKKLIIRDIIQTMERLESLKDQKIIEEDLYKFAMQEEEKLNENSKTLFRSKISMSGTILNPPNSKNSNKKKKNRDDKEEKTDD